MAFNLNKFYSWAIGTCNASNVGYSMTYRNKRTVNGVTFYDCSSFVNYALLAGGAQTPGYAPNSNPFTTYTEGAVLESLGWKKVNASGEYKAGDIGLSSTHTEICYKGGNGSGVFMGAHTNFIGGWGINLNNLQNQVSIGSSSGDPSHTRSFPTLYRYGSGGAGAEDPGINIYVIAAICGNFWGESSLNPGIWESLISGSFTDLNKGFGLGQWTNTGGDTHGRLYQLHSYMSGRGLEDSDLYGQLDYVKKENVWHKGASYQQAITFNSLEEFFNSKSTDLDYLVKAWMYCWEGIATSDLANRQGYAKKCLDYIRAHAEDPSIFTYYKGNRYLSEAERLNNVVMIYRYWNAGGGGGGGTPTDEKKNMPVWMMIKYHA